MSGAVAFRTLRTGSKAGLDGQSRPKTDHSDADLVEALRGSGSITARLRVDLARPLEESMLKLQAVPPTSGVSLGAVVVDVLHRTGGDWPGWIGWGGLVMRV